MIPTNEEGGQWSGMSLRDWFAGQAMSGILACPNPVVDDDGSTDGQKRLTVILAYEVADLMLAERLKIVPAEPVHGPRTAN